jgi:4-aminobutyrate aminotransferase
VSPKKKTIEDVGPWLVTSLPGPKSKKIVARDERYVSPSYTRAFPVVVDRTEGLYVYDVDGNRFLDMHAGISVCNVGNNNPEVIAAVQEQVRRAIHIATADFYHPLTAELAERLGRTVPGMKRPRVFFTNSGTESVEAGMKLARYHTRKPIYIAFTGSFHGRSFGSLSLTASKKVQRERFAPLLPTVVHVPYPNPYRPLFGAGSTKNGAREYIDYIEQHVFARVAPPEDVAAIVVEPIQGEGGYIVPPDGFIKNLRELADKHDILLMADEVQSGNGRTGKHWAIDHEGVIPDILVTAKGLANGMPLGACISSASVMKWGPGSHSTTWGGSPPSCAAAIAVLDLLEGGLIENAAKMGKHFKRGLQTLQKTHRLIGDVRGRGLMLAVELVRDRATKERAVAERDALVNVLYKRGVMTLGCGESGIRFIPPLTIDRAHVDHFLDILDEALTKVEKRRFKSR